MKYAELKDIKKLYFGYEEIARALGVSQASAKVSASRYVRQNLLIRIKRNLYVLKDRWAALDRREKFVLANLAQVPSYISLMTALDYYEVTTQVQRGFIESIALKRTRTIEVDGDIFKYSKIDKRFYFGFSRADGFFIVTPEKAFLDAIYLTSLRRYSFDLSSIDFNKLNKAAIRSMARKYPLRIRRLLEGYGYS
jgi:predicted transcriptional regulator of viral defense system